MDLWNQNSYHNYDRPTLASWLWRRDQDVRHNQNNCSVLLAIPRSYLAMYYDVTSYTHLSIVVVESAEHY